MDKSNRTSRAGQFTRNELLQAARALLTILARGDEHEFAYILREHSGGCAANPRDALSTNEYLSAHAVAEQLSPLLGISRELANEVCCEVYSASPERRRFAAILCYGAELNGKQEKVNSLRDDFNRFGLDAMIAPSRYGGDQNDLEPAQRSRSVVPTDNVRFVRKGSA